MTEFHNPATATLEEARHVVELIRKSLRYANGEDAADLSYDLATWERVVARLDVDPMQPLYDEQDAAAIEEDRRFEQHRDERQRRLV
jgi:hypothetical protein